MKKMVFEKYLIKVVDPRIPDYIYAMFPSISQDPETLSKVYKAYKLGTDSEYAQSYFALKGRGVIITKLGSYKIIPDKRVIQATLANGFTVFIPIELLDVHDPDELVEKLKLPMEIHVQYKKGYLIAEEVRLPSLKSYKDIGKEIVEEIGALNAILVGLGIMPDRLTYCMFLPRIIGLFKGFKHETEKVAFWSIHVMQLTSPNTGKSHFAVRISDIVNYEYLGGELPTPAKLVYDGRSLQIGLVGLRDGIIFDEFDKKASQITQALAQELRLLLSGMEQCVWTRGSGTKTIQIRKCVNFIVFGNVPPITKGNTTREMICNYFNVSGMDAFIDRFAIVDIWTGHYNISQYVTYQVFPNSILRGIIEYIQEQIRPEPLSIEIRGSREPRHAMNVKSILNALNVWLDDDTIARLVLGQFTFEHLYKVTPANQIDMYFKDWNRVEYIKNTLKNSSNIGTEVPSNETSESST